MIGISEAFAQFARLLEICPKCAWMALVISLGVTGLMIWGIESGRPQREAEYAAWWKAKMECRQSGGQYEYFGTEGYACVGVKK